MHAIVRGLIGPATLMPLMLAAVAGCKDVRYQYDIPQATSDCPSGTIYRSGGSAIRDRSGGTAIRDRNGGTVTAYCEEILCPGGDPPVGDPVMDWHLDPHEVVVATRTCPATEPSP